jgi:hypothetical protein
MFVEERVSVNCGADGPAVAARTLTPHHPPLFHEVEERAGDRR